MFKSELKIKEKRVEKLKLEANLTLSNEKIHIFLSLKFTYFQIQNSKEMTNAVSRNPGT